MEPETVIYIACGPEALARDAAKFHNLGYCLDTLQPVDLFPDTAHIECVARLRRVQKKADGFHRPLSEPDSIYFRFASKNDVILSNGITFIL